MNIELSTGLDFFWQWDANLKLKVPDGIPEVHFRFENKSKAYEVKDGWVSVPNELLQKVDDIECWFYDSEHTMDFGRIEGRRRPKPDGYVYEETEFKSWTELDEKITKALEELEKTNTTLEEVKDEVGESLKFTEQELTDEQKVQSRKNIEVFSSEEVKNEIKSNTPDWEQNDSEGKGFIKNKPFYDTREAILRNTYEDWAAAGGHNGNDAKPILSFTINNEIYEGIAPTVYNAGYTKVYNIPSYENRKYQIVAYTNANPPSLECRDVRSNETVENWSIYPPKETGEIHYLDPKYIEDMYYTEPEKWGTTFDEWLSVVGENTTTVAGKELTIKYNGTIYENIVPSYIDGNHLYKVTPEGQNSETVVIAAGVTGIWLADNTSFLLSKEQIHKIPEKYYDYGTPFVITVTDLSEDDNCKIDRSWEEITKELSKNDTPQHYVIRNKNIPCDITIEKIIVQPETDGSPKILFGGKYITVARDVIITTEWFISSLIVASTKANYRLAKLSLPVAGYALNITGDGTASSPYTSDKSYINISTAYIYNIPIYATLDNIKGQFLLTSLTENGAYFHGSTNTNSIYRIVIKNTDEVVVYANHLEQISHRVSEITEENSQTTTNYPNVAAVKSYVDEKVQGVISFDSLVVNELPETGVKGVVYFVPHTHLWSNDSYDEYMWTGEKFEKIGNTDIDLTNYVKKDELPTS